MSQLTQVTITRPADTTTYAAGDVIGGLLTFSAGQAQGAIETALLVDSTAETLKPECDLFLFSKAPTVAAENAAFAPTDAEMSANCFGVLVFLAANFHTTGINGCTHCLLQQSPLMDFVAPSGLFYGVLVARNAYVPVTGEIITVKLGLRLT